MQVLQRNIQHQVSDIFFAKMLSFIIWSEAMQQPYINAEM
jgi:hypothetical protein